MPKRKIDTMSWAEIVQEVAAKIGKSDDKKFIQWFTEKEQVGYLFDPNLIRRCYAIYNQLNDDRDHFLIISGREGDGKSTLGIQICSYIHPTIRPFGKDLIAYSASQFIHALKTAPKGSAILMDEGGQTMFSREAMSLVNKMLVKTFMVMRQRNLCVVICIPNFHLLDYYVRMHRVNTLLQLTQRGKYAGYIGNGISTIARDGAKYRQVLGIKVPQETVWPGYFNKDFPKTLSREDYIKTKEANMIEFLDKLEQDHDFLEIKMVAAARAAKEIGCDARTIISLVKKGELEGRQIGAMWYLSKQAYKKLLGGQ